MSAPRERLLPRIIISLRGSFGPSVNSEVIAKRRSGSSIGGGAITIPADDADDVDEESNDIAPSSRHRHHGRGVDSMTTDLAIRAAERRRTSFRGSLPESLIALHDVRDAVAPFRLDEVVLGPKLGEGEYSNVFEVASFALRDDFVASDDDIDDINDDAPTKSSHSCHRTPSPPSDDEIRQRMHMKSMEKYRTTGKARYALKHIKDHENDTDKYVQAAGDLALEAELLSSLVHPNIIKLRGISYGGAYGFEHGPRGYYLIIDRLYEILDQRIRRWHGPRRLRGGSRTGRLFASLTGGTKLESARGSANADRGGIDCTVSLDEKLDVALQISAAVTYLHGHSVICRDLKPNNIGFDVRGDVKLFDFGLARVIPNGGNPYVDTFEMSGAGTPRYMAPECLCGRPYNMKADVYTFAVILWEILNGGMPYGFVKGRSHLVRCIVEENVRPPIDGGWPSSVKGMLESSFDSEIEKRPKMGLWFDIIGKEISYLRGGDNSRVRPSFVSRRRTFESMRNIFQIG